MKKLLIPFFALCLLGGQVALSPEAEARRGCCSHHGGVEGCACADGTPLSAKCAPYYPHCGGGGGQATGAFAAKARKPAPKPMNHNCQTMVAGPKGTWIFTSPDLKSKILVKLTPGQKVVKTGAQPAGPFLRVQVVGSQTIGFAHKSVCGCP